MCSRRLWGQGGEALEGGLAVGVEADVLPVLRRGAVAVVGDGGAGEVEGAAVGGGDYFYGVGVGDVFGGAEDFEGGDFDVRVGEGAEQRGEVLGFEEGFVALDVDVDVGVVVAGDGVDAVGAAGEIGRGELDGPVVAMAELGDFVGVGGDEDVVELRAGAWRRRRPRRAWGVRRWCGGLCGRQAGGGEAQGMPGEGEVSAELDVAWIWLGFGLRDGFSPAGSGFSVCGNQV